MAHKKKGHLTTTVEWSKHLRKYMKNQFWRGERNAGKRLIRKELFETDNAMWRFEELVKTLIAMSSSFERQKEIYGFGATADEMLMDFYSHYTLNKVKFLERKFITNESKKLLDDIDSLTDSWSDEKEEDFWFEMENYEEDWNVLRGKAKLALVKLGKDKCTVEVKHENNFDENGNIVMQKTKIELKENEG
ncbi:hypothetical protein [uncultured Kordia sp.]|uniref:hypothetical protein n=1 Tax=uncultured Kordia sp. TaxID=507699 RepID=UPI00261A4C19|nr:hypothetical protein [uncultured Kordia sp.]